MPLPELHPLKGDIEFLRYMKFSFIFIAGAFLVYYFTVLNYLKYLDANKKVFIDHKWDLKKEVKTLNKLITADRSEFYSSLSKIVRDYIKLKHNIEAHPKTLFEIESLNIPDEVKELFKDIYSKEFNKLSEDSLQIRETLIHKITTITK